MAECAKINDYGQSTNENFPNIHFGHFPFLGRRFPWETASKFATACAPATSIIPSHRFPTKNQKREALSVPPSPLPLTSYLPAPRSALRVPHSAPPSILNPHSAISRTFDFRPPTFNFRPSTVHFPPFHRFPRR